MACRSGSMAGSKDRYQSHCRRNTPSRRNRSAATKTESTWCGTSGASSCQIVGQPAGTLLDLQAVTAVAQGDETTQRHDQCTAPYPAHERLVIQAYRPAAIR